MKRSTYKGLDGQRISRVEANARIEKLIRERDKAGGKYSPEEKTFIAQYSGDGGRGRSNVKGKGVLYEYYTPGWLCERMWELARNHGFTGGNVIDPAVGTGNFLAHAPEVDKITGFEINPVSFRVAQIHHPKAKLHLQPFETAFLKQPDWTAPLKDKATWLRGYPFDLAIGNPPFGGFKSPHREHFPGPTIHRLEAFFTIQAVRLLRPGGLLIFLVLSQWFRNGNKYNAGKKLLGEMAEMVDFYRLPRLFKGSKINVDLIILRKL